MTPDLLRGQKSKVKVTKRSVLHFGTAACHLDNTSNNDSTHFHMYSLGGSNLRKLR